MDSERTPAQVISAVTTQDAARPLLTWYDDAAGERLDLTGASLGKWIAKAGNALQEEFDAQPGTVVRIDLPCPHWRALYWAMATWAVGATVAVDDSEGADVLVTADPTSELAQDADEVVAVSLPALARGWDGEPLPTGVLDEAGALATYGDVLDAWHSPDPDDDALAAGGERTTYAELLTGDEAPGEGGDSSGGHHPASAPGAERVLVSCDDLRLTLVTTLRTWAGGGSVVLVAGEADPADPRWATEGVTRTA